MRFSFAFAQERFSCASPERRLDFVRPEQFQNLQSVFQDGSILFDGYTMYFQGDGMPECSGEAFTVSLRILPLNPARRKSTLN